MSTKNEHLSERCQATHAAIKEGRTTLMPIGVMPPIPGESSLYLYNCPHCGSTISCPEAPQ